ncbi:hypothetical protein EST38_g9164 [Candolleomyces aberdarensis]|uniref:F-box domain-containing protein n=1 Tax=Candolleomyces aberdarensis TaxID=2316362 RepID=A0A4V1Q2Y3_9AGAR|nr:hypothetical protein EST38_g9164 [Candolleomyces aberdarensis]
MSTLKTDRAGERRPQFPPEIWLMILRTVTDVPDPLVYPHLVLPDSKTSQGMLSEYASRRYRQCLIMKRLVVGVCRQWYAFANKFMFEHIVIDKPWQLGVLLQTLPRLPAGRIDPGDRRTLGWFVKRLDLLIPNLEWLRTKRKNSAIYSAAPQLYTLLPSLLSLNVSGAPLSYFPSGTTVISPNLKQLCWTDGTSPTLQDMKVKELSLFMKNHPNVTVMCFPPVEVHERPPETNSSLGDWDGWLCQGVLVVALYPGYDPDYTEFVPEPAGV